MKPGEYVRLHDGRRVKVRKDGRVPGGSRERMLVRGFVRGELVDVETGEKQTGDWCENVITTKGHGVIVNNFIGAAGSSIASYWAIGYHTADSSVFSTQTALQTEYGLASSDSTAGSRATVSGLASGIQQLSGTWSLSQSGQFAATQISHNVSLNAVAQYGVATVGSGSALSIATFNSSQKATSQALNVTWGESPRVAA